MFLCVLGERKVHTQQFQQFPGTFPWSVETLFLSRRKHFLASRISVLYGSLTLAMQFAVPRGIVSHWMN